MKSDHWFHDLFRAMPDLVRHLLPELAAERPPPASAQAPPPAPAGAGSPDLSLPPEVELPGESAYTFRPLVLKKQAHSPDGVLWPRDHPGGSASWPVVLLEVQMHPDRGFQRRLGAETFRLVQQQEQIEHLRVVVLQAHRRLALGSGGPLLLRRFLRQVSPGWIYQAWPASPISTPPWPCSLCRCNRKQISGPVVSASSGCIPIGWS